MNIMSLCTVCGKILCGHTPKERGQTREEIARDLTSEEEELWEKEPTGSEKLKNLAKKNAHLLVI